MKNFPTVISELPLDDENKNLLIDLFTEEGNKKKVTDIINTLPELEFSIFLITFSRYATRDNENKDKGTLLSDFIQLILMFPYLEGLIDWLNTDIPNLLIELYRSYGCTIDEAEELHKQGVEDKDSMEEYYSLKIGGDIPDTEEE